MHTPIRDLIKYDLQDPTLIQPDTLERADLSELPETVSLAIPLREGTQALIERRGSTLRITGSLTFGSHRFANAIQCLLFRHAYDETALLLGAQRRLTIKCRRQGFFRAKVPSTTSGGELLSTLYSDIDLILSTAKSALAVAAKGPDRSDSAPDVVPKPRVD